MSALINNVGNSLSCLGLASVVYIREWTLFAHGIDHGAWASDCLCAVPSGLYLGRWQYLKFWISGSHKSLSRSNRDRLFVLLALSSLFVFVLVPSTRTLLRPHKLWNGDEILSYLAKKQSDPVNNTDKYMGDKWSKTCRIPNSQGFKTTTVLIRFLFWQICLYRSFWLLCCSMKPALIHFAASFATSVSWYGNFMIINRDLFVSCCP